MLDLVVELGFVSFSKGVLETRGVRKNLFFVWVICFRYRGICLFLEIIKGFLRRS